MPNGRNVIAPTRGDGEIVDHLPHALSAGSITRN
jgi:hypothetical protein